MFDAGTTSPGLTGSITCRQVPPQAVPQHDDVLYRSCSIVFLPNDKALGRESSSVPRSRMFYFFRV